MPQQHNLSHQAISMYIATCKAGIAKMPQADYLKPIASKMCDDGLQSISSVFSKRLSETLLACGIQRVT